MLTLRSDSGAADGFPVRLPDRLRAGLGHQEGRLRRGKHAIGLLIEPLHTGGPPDRQAWYVGTCLQRGPHLVVRVAGGDVEGPSQCYIVDGGALVADTCGDELVRARVLANDRRLPRDEVGDQGSLVAAPLDLVLGRMVAVRRPQFGPVREPMRPVGQSPLPVQFLDGALLVLQELDEHWNTSRLCSRCRLGSLSAWKPVTAGCRA